MSKWQIVGLVVGGMVVIGLVVAAFVLGDSVSRLVGVLGFLVAAGKVGYDVWDKAVEKRKKHEAANVPITFDVRTPRFFFKHVGPGGSYQNSTREEASSISYVFTLNIFNNRPENVGLGSLEIQYRRGGSVIHRHVPTGWTGETRHGQVYCPPVPTITLPAKEWIEVPFHGGIGGDQKFIHTVGDCDGVYLTATSTAGEQVEVRLADRILNVHQARALNG